MRLVGRRVGPAGGRAMIHDFAVIGGGISGASAAHGLAASGSVVLLEAEAQPGHHATGRSAALFTPNYGPPVVRRVLALAHGFFHDPPDGLVERPLLSRRGAITVAAPGEEDRLPPLPRLSPAQALRLAPLLRPERVAATVLDDGVDDIDAAALHQGYLAGLRARGGEVLTDHRVEAMAREGGAWRLEARRGTVRARVVVNAAGAWADQVGAVAGAAPIGLVPKRRTAILLDPPEGTDLRAMPLVDFAADAAYLKPEAGMLMASLGDATPCEPSDTQPEELDVALLAERVERETTLVIRRIPHRWAGLRSFVADGAPVVGFDARAPDFLWLAGQGGYGIMMAPTLADAATALATTGRWPAAMRDGGIAETGLSPHRLT